MQARTNRAYMIAGFVLSVVLILVMSASESINPLLVIVASIAILYFVAVIIWQGYIVGKEKHVAKKEADDKEEQK